MTTEESSGKKGGLIDSVKNMAATLIGMVETRLALLSTELEEEREWLISMLTWSYIALFCAVLTVTLATLLVIVIFWDSYRLTAIVILLGIFTLATGFAWQTVKRLTRNKPRLFSATLMELSKDRENLVSRHEP
jgi:uncharacterized membrane protein YqjE